MAKNDAAHERTRCCLIAASQQRLISWTSIDSWTEGLVVDCRVYRKTRKLYLWIPTVCAVFRKQHLDAGVSLTIRRKISLFLLDLRLLDRRSCSRYDCRIVAVGLDLFTTIASVSRAHAFFLQKMQKAAIIALTRFTVGQLDTPPYIDAHITELPFA